MQEEASGAAASSRRDCGEGSRRSPCRGGQDTSSFDGMSEDGDRDETAAVTAQVRPSDSFAQPVQLIVPIFLLV